MSFLSRSLASLAALGYDNSRRHLVAAATLVAATPFLLYGLEIDADAAKLIPDSDPVGAAYRDSRAVFGESNPLILELRHDGVAPDELDAFTDRLAAILDGWDDIRYVTARPLDLIDRSGMAWRLRAALLNAGPEELEAFRSKLSEEGMRRQLLRTRKRLVALDDPRLRALLARDPLDVRSHLAGLERQRVRDWDRPRESIYFDSVDGRSRLLYVQPLGSAEDSTYCRLLLERIGGAAREARRGLSTTSGIETRVTGVHALTAQSTDVLLADLALVTGVATAALFALLWLAFGRLRATLLCFLPLLVAQLAVLSLARLAFNPIHPLTIGFAAVVVGLGLDIGLHMTGRLAQFLDELPLEDAIRSTFADAGPPVVVGAVSTTLAFLALLVTGNRGLVQFGVLAALGLVVTLIATLLLFPALARHLVGSASSGRDLELRGAPTPLLRFVTRRPGASMAIGLALAVVALPYAARFRFETDVAGLFPSGLEATEVASEIATAHEVPPGATSLVTIRAVDLSSAMALQREVDRHLIALVEQGAVSAF